MKTVGQAVLYGTRASLPFNPRSSALRSRTEYNKVSSGHKSLHEAADDAHRRLLAGLNSEIAKVEPPTAAQAAVPTPSAPSPAGDAEQTARTIAEQAETPAYACKQRPIARPRTSGLNPYCTMSTTTASGF